MRLRSYTRSPKNLISTRISVLMSVSASVKTMVTHWFNIFNSRQRFNVNTSRSTGMFLCHSWIISRRLLGRTNQNPNQAKRPKRIWRKIEVPSVLSTKISKKKLSSRIKANSPKTAEITQKDLSICPRTQLRTTLPSRLSMAPCLTGQAQTQHRHAKLKLKFLWNLQLRWLSALSFRYLKSKQILISRVSWKIKIKNQRILNQIGLKLCSQR